MVTSARVQRGYTYLALLFAVALMGAGLAAAGVFWHTAQVREKERELLYVGDQYKKAIERYYKQGKTYPRELPQLVRDQRTPDVRRYLRKLYRDPVTNKNEWGLVKTPDGGIVGIFSLSEQTPLKTANFPVAYAEFEGKTKYSEWKFVYSPQSTPGGGAPGGAQQRAPGAAGASQQSSPASGAASGQQPSGAQSSQPGRSSTLQQGTSTGAAPGTPQQGTAGAPQSTSPGGFGLLEQSARASGTAQGAQQGTAGAPQGTSSGGFGLLQQSAPATGPAGAAQQNAPPIGGGAGISEPAPRSP